MERSYRNNGNAVEVFLNVTRTTDSEIQTTGKVLDESSEVIYDKSDTPILTQNGEQRQRGEWSFVVSASKGKLTGKVSAVDGDMSKSIKSVSYYNRLGMLLQQHTTNIRSGKDIVAYSYDFTGNCIKKKQIHSSEGNKTHTLEFTYTYDRMGRQLGMEISYDDTLAVKVNAFRYDDMGRLVANERNGMESLRSTYGYDIRHHLTDISSENFSQKIHYVDANNGNTPCYNGNISAMEWSVGYKGVNHGYAYKYDGLSRLISADYYRNGKKTGDYSTDYTYDLMGNVKSQTRNGLLDDRSHGLVDNLSYEYYGNQVTRVTDAVSGPYYKNAMHFVDGADEKVEYEYNKNGAMTKNLNKGIEQIAYNQLNLPTKVLFSDGSIISNSYDADGNRLRTNYHIKLQSAVSSSNDGNSNAKYIDYRRDYCGNVEYRDDELSCWRYEGGHLEFAEDDSPVYLYELKDYQSNVRVSVTGDKDNVITDANHYYPFGGLMGCSQVGAYQYRYNDKELELTHGLNWYDYGARSYDGMRFVAPDAHAENYTPFSPYAYCLDNPIRLIDKDGNDPGDFFLSMDEAAIDFAKIYNGLSIINNIEYSSSIVAVYNDKGKLGYTYLLPIAGTESASNAVLKIDSSHTTIATIHTHGKYSETEFGTNICDYFSGEVYWRQGEKVLFCEEVNLKNVKDSPKNSTDIGSANKYGIPIFVATPNGKLRKYNPKTSKITDICFSIPSDMNDPKRVNFLLPERKYINSILCIYNTYKLLNNKKK